MKTELPAVVAEYLELIERDTPRAGPELHAFAKLVRRVFETEDLRVETERLDKYLSLQKYFPFRLFPWQKCLLALWLCVYRQDGLPRWDTLFYMLGRGGGKDGFFAYISFCLVSPYNPVKFYDVDICANNEEQAMRPVNDVLEVLNSPALEAKLNRHYYHTKELIQGRRNRGTIKGRTNNPKNRDGMRSGVILLNEVHAYQNYDNISVFTGGLGKKPEPRTGVGSSNGEVSDGPLDDYLKTGEEILFGDMPDNGFLPFICRLTKVEQVHDEANWPMANPSLPYLPALLEENRREYRIWLLKPEEMPQFLSKRMGIRTAVKDIAVTDYEKVKATNQELPDMSGWSCTVGIDYAELSDWAAINLHFRRGNERFDINHAWVCSQSKTLPRVRAPWQAWAEQGHLTVVDDVSIGGDLLAAYIRQAGQRYNIRMLAMDHYRWTLLAESLKGAGFDAADKSRVKLVRPSDIMTVEPVIQECFDRGLFHWGDNPCLRWAVNNTKRVRSSRSVGSDTGNFYYAKIEAKSRKTDPFMALAASMVVEPSLGTGLPLELPPVAPVIFW